MEIAIATTGGHIGPIIDLLRPTLTAAPEISTVVPASLGVAEDASLVVWFWSPW